MAPAARPRYDATIKWTKHGIPHITADDFASLSCGSGFAAAEALIYTLMDTPVTDLHNRRVVGGLLAGRSGPQRVTRQMDTGYVAGVNTWLRTRKVTDPTRPDPTRPVGRGLPAPGRQAHRPLLRRLPRQPARLHGGLSARAILTYGQDKDPRSRFFSDQTRLFSQEKWVDFAWTDCQITGDLVRTLRLRG